MLKNRWSRISILGLGTLILWSLILRFPTEGVPPDLDPTWSLLMALGFEHGAQAGKDLVFTYGPLGYFATSNGPFVEDTYWIKLLVECFTKGLIAFALVRFTLGMSQPWIRLVLYLFLIAVSPWSQESIYFLAITAACLTVLSNPDDRRSGILVAALIAPLGLAKFTFGMMGLCSVTLVALGKAFQRQGLSSLLPLLAFVTSFLLCWVCLGQSLGNLPLFIKGSLEISSGYNQSMFLKGPQSLVYVAMIGLVVWFAWVAVAWWKGERVGIRFVRASLLLAPALLCWKAGFVRQDAGHSLTFFSTLAVFPLWGLSILPVWRPRLVMVLALVPLGLGWAGIFKAGITMHRSPIRLVPILQDQFAENASSLLQPQATFESIKKDLLAKRLANRLPTLRAIIGSEAADEIPHTAAILYLNDIEIRHRPIFQSYSAYTPYLQTLNGRFFESEAAPTFVLIRPEEIDGKVPLQADSQTYRVLLQRYIPIASERGWLLLRKRMKQPTSRITGERQGTAEASGKAMINTWISLPEGVGLGELAVQFEASMLGKLKTLLYVPSYLYLDVRRQDGTIASYRSPIPSMRLPFILDPSVASAGSLFELYMGKMREQVIAFRLRPTEGREYGFDGEFDWTFDRTPLPSADGIPDALIQRMVNPEFPDLHLPIVAMEPRSNFRIGGSEGQEVLLAHPESMLALQAPKGRHRFLASFGIDRGAWTKEGLTDGVAFRITVASPSAIPKVIFQRFLDPLRNPGDRGMQSVDIPVTWDAPVRLILETLPGANSAWDWAYWTKIDLIQR